MAKQKKPAVADQGRYAARGVSASKADVHSAVDHLDRGLYPGAFCKIIPDVLTGDPSRCAVIHSDGAGTKALVAYLTYRETGDATVFQGTAQDSIVMNIDDMLCVGAYRGLLISNTVNRNAVHCPAVVIAELIRGTEQFLETLRGYGVDIHSGGGETADTGDLTGAVVVDTCAVAVLDRNDVITGDGIRPGLDIIGLASYGQASYETKVNSGIGSNGLTSARHDLLSKYYAETYPETFDKNIEPSLVYCGRYKLGDSLPDGNGTTVGDALLSPTRTYAPLIVKLLTDARETVQGLTHCTGGGQTKCLRFGRGVHYIKDNLLPVPPVFKTIQDSSGTTLNEMFRVYNMGHRMEVYCEPSDGDGIIDLARSFGIAAQRVGRIIASTDGRNRLTIEHQGGILEY